MIHLCQSTGTSHTLKHHSTQLTLLSLRNTPRSPESRLPSLYPSWGHPAPGGLWVFTPFDCHRPESAICRLYPDFINKGFMNTAMSIRLQVVYGCFLATTAQGHSRNRPVQPAKPKIVSGPVQVCRSAIDQDVNDLPGAVR